ncbi:carbamoyltransferase HypF [Paracoccus sp. p4-l81]|uniref:carbamoyltransferase HypF n=1 Tax=Paracoccus sp. p4-l81 TaxID=3342806 RepID=UPI0035B80C4D
MAGKTIRVRGQVQGVGFRPFVWQLARDHGVAGQVMNDPEGVLIEAFGGDLDGFLVGLRDRAPPLARVDAVEVGDLAGPAPKGFVIGASRGQGAETRVTPDAATCDACRDEVFGTGRRAGYAFTNCTHCGPRFSILNGLPYDRARTTMARFRLCDDCRAEYGDPADRRFHAQPIACPACGPRLWAEDRAGEVAGDPVAWAASALAAGQVLAIKGLGGFHLGCDALNADAVARLRDRKRRPTKPFAVMGTRAMIGDLCAPSPAEWALLADPAAPIVLIACNPPAGIAPGLGHVGWMLPYTPLHHLLLAAVGRPLVMTSGNLSGEPQVIGNDEARAKLSGFVDGFLMHDRDIARRLDDSVERATPPMVLRRARGRVPGVLPLPPGFEGAPQVLAMGGQMKGAICLTKRGQAMLSHHLGDLDGALNRDQFHRAIADLGALFDHQPARIAIDLHPGYAASQAGQAMADAMGLPLIAVQHHHAHLAACLAEAGWARDGGQVAGIVLDGTGLGTDGQTWGAEVLLGDYHGVTRIAHLAPAPLPGGDLAARDPWRNLLVRLDQAGLADLSDRLLAGQPVAALRAAVAAAVNAPMASSMGRLFDAAAALLGLCLRQSHEGEAAMRLEAVARDAPPYPLPGLDPAPMLRAMAADLAAGRDLSLIAGAFHAGIARAFAGVARGLVERGEARAVVLSGGCFQNARLLAAFQAELAGLPVISHRTTPAGDGGLALGQAVIAAVSG